jgi:dihydrodipicolinate synthase/N-acetylneuraminate lyase
MTDQAREIVAKVAEQGGAGLAVGSGFVAWVSANYYFIAGIGVIAGIVIGLAGLAVNTYYQWKRDQREAARPL